MKIEVQWFEGCPHAEPARLLAREVAARMVPEAQLVETIVEDEAHALAIRFQGSPSILVDGRDLEGRDEPAQGLACRLYAGGGPIPEALLEDAILRAQGQEPAGEVVPPRCWAAWVLGGLHRSKWTRRLRLRAVAHEPCPVPWVGEGAAVAAGAAAHRARRLA